MTKCMSSRRSSTAVVGSHKSLQVAMARGLFATWKQPVFAKFDTKMTPEILKSIIIELENTRYHVVAAVSDCGGGNQGLWKELGIDIIKDHTITKMDHPSTGSSIYLLADPPHLLKLIRNWLLDTGFWFKGRPITKKYLEKLVDLATTVKSTKNSSEYNSLFKLTKKHVMCKGPERQNVPMAVELLSHTTAVNLVRHFGEDEEAVLLAEFIEIVDKWFNLWNSHSLNENIVSKKCYGLSLVEQDKILADMEWAMASIRTLDKQGAPTNCPQIFQKGVIMGINSLRGLYNDMKISYDIFYIMLYKLNQDDLENFFGQMRQKGGGPNNHPSALDALNRMRIIILGKGLKNQLGANVNSQKVLIQEDFLITRIFKEAKKEQHIIGENADRLDWNCPHADKTLQEQNHVDCLDWNSPSAEKTLQEQDGFDYAAGFLARKLRSSMPDLGEYSFTSSENDSNYIMNLSHGGLTVPNEEWKVSVERMDLVFNQVHGGPDKLLKTNSKATSLSQLREKFPEKTITELKAYINMKFNIHIRLMKMYIKID